VALQVASWSNWVKAGAQEIIRATEYYQQSNAHHVTSAFQNRFVDCWTDLIRSWLRGDQSACRGDALPGAIDLDPGVHKTFAVDVGFPFSVPFTRNVPTTTAAFPYTCTLLCSVTAWDG